MNEQKLHEIEFVDAKHYDLYQFSQYLHLKVLNPGHFFIEEQETHDRHKVSLGNQIFYVTSNFLNQFWLILNRAEEGDYPSLAEKVYEEKDIIVRPAVDMTGQVFELDPSDPSYSLTGLDYVSVESRIKGLMTTVSATIREVANMVNKEMNAIALDSNVVKDFDGIMTFSTELGSKFNMELCFDKVPPVDENNDHIEIMRTPITPEDLKTYFPSVGYKIQSRLGHINDLVRAVFESKRIAEIKELHQYAEMLINGVLIPSFLNQNVNYVTFGGRDDWSSAGKETPNNVACFKYLDPEVDKLLKFLDSIPLEEGVEVYSIELDTFAIFGRKDNKVVTPALQGYVEDILKPFSQGFERVLTQRLSLLDSPHVFKS